MLDLLDFKTFQYPGDDIPFYKQESRDMEEKNLYLEFGNH
jgi:hypothetical protein